MNVQNPEAYVLSCYPLSGGFRKAVERVAGTNVVYISVAELRRMSFAKMVFFLRKMHKKAILYIPLEDPQSESMYPLILGLVALSSVESTVVVGADCSLRDVRKSEIFSAIPRVGVGMISGLLALAWSQFAGALLVNRQRRECADIQSKRQILYVNTNYWFGIRVGGSIGHIAGVINAFSDLGYGVDLASASPQPMTRPAVRQIPIKGLRTQAYPIELNLLRFHWHVWNQLRALNGACYRFIYQRMSLFNFAGVALSRLWRIPLVLEYNGSEVWISRNWGKPLRFSALATTLEGACLRHAHRVVVVSRALAEEVIRRGVDPKRVVCYPNCVDPSHFSPEAVPKREISVIRERHGIAPDECLVSFVGTFGRWHGAPVFAEAIRNLIERHPSWLGRGKVRFAMIGDGATMPDVRRLIGLPEYAKWVLFTGLVPQSETVKYLAASDILVSPHVANADGSRFFGSPTKLFEYMAMGKGIIASDLDQIGEVLAAGIRIWSDSLDSRPFASAILVRPGNVDDLNRSLRFLVERPAVRRAIGVAARGDVLRKYTWHHHVTKILDSLEEAKCSEAANAMRERKTEL